jgi:hypothetical protein
MSAHTQTPETSRLVLGLHDTAIEAAARLNVALDLLNRHDCKKAEDRCDRNSPGGYDLWIIGEIVEQVRNALIDSTAAN